MFSLPNTRIFNNCFSLPQTKNYNNIYLRVRGANFCLCSFPVATGGLHRRRGRGGHVDLFGDDLLAAAAATASGGGTVE